ncbi:hypothetical protein [Natronorubrum aibiense]|uniref:Uncharacterized protein n=1 Tax=Natronorubrum aibiense TaxID=348826 RepID=A0A5P9P9R3_9EURY|nr:hypothetical protein [Natronorubrum aibiense]QFU84620.1 hypothetical protein GCU68_18975 [Natronorubrum aibiense]
MSWQPEYTPTGLVTTADEFVATPDELLCHLREAGAATVYLARTDAFRDGVIPVVATYGSPPVASDPFTAAETTDELTTESVPKMLRRVFESIGDRLRFHGHEWVLEWDIKPAFTEPRPTLVPLYDRSVEEKYGDGFNLWNLYFVYEESQRDTSTRR